MMKPIGRTKRPTSISLLSVFVSVALFALKPGQENPPAKSTEIPDKLPSGNYIIRFLEYRPAEGHRAYLQQSVEPVGWRWIDRRNPAASFPTDFGLVSIEDSFRSVLIQEFEKLGGVKDVSVDMTYARSLLADDRRSADVNKGPGKLFTKMSFEGDIGAEIGNSTNFLERKLLMQRSQVTSIFGAEVLWAKGYKGRKVKMAIFDTGIRANHPHFHNIKERTNWTNENTLNDNLGHGTFVAGVIAGADAECPGFAPDAEIYAFRVFTDAQVMEIVLYELTTNNRYGDEEVSYTSWFLDAFNYAIATDMDVLNLSIGGPDYLDLPFVEKVWELTASNIIMVSAIGNDGPLYGTLNNPADQNDVIGVGGIDYNDHIAPFSSRGMSTWELPHGYGRMKPDVVAYGKDIMGSKISTGCKSLSGTSVASPVVAGVVCLLVSVLPESLRKNILNPASMKQALVEGATKLSGSNMYEQGAGRLNLLESFEILQNYQPRASIFPSVLDYTDCPYSWPFCRQPLFAGAMPVIFNATILNGMGVIGYVEDPPMWQPSNEIGNLLSIHFTYSDVIWPWTGFLALHMQIKDEGAQFSGVIEGNVTLRVYSPSRAGVEGPRRSSTCVLQLKLKMIPTPPRSKRVLWDQYHNIKYPPGYIPRDSLDVRNDILDWHGDHLHTNFHLMYNMLVDAGYYVETLGSPLTCFDADRYGTLLMVDLEEEYFKEEIDKLRDDVINRGLGLAVFADWYNVETMVKMRFFDDNTRSWWTPITGGANIPALNELLAPFGIAFGDKILNGDFYTEDEQSHYASGANIVRFPGGGYLHSFQLQDISEGGATRTALLSSGMTKVQSPILGLVGMGGGRVAVYGDSNCLDSSHMVTNCYWLLKKILDFTGRNVKDSVLFSDSARRNSPLLEDDKQMPYRRKDVNFSAYSAVVGKELICQSDARFDVWGTKGYLYQVRGRNRKLPGYPTIDLGSELNLTIGNSRPGENSSSVAGRKGFSKTMDFLGLINGEEIDVPMLVASQWLVPALVAIFGFLLFWSCFWRVRQRRRRRRRSGSGSGRLANV